MQPLVYEGSDPEQLLLDVWEQHGTNVRITEPEELRRGGVFGFFSRIVYRIEVEPTGLQAPPASPPAAPGAVATTAPGPPAAADPGSTQGAALNHLADSTEDVLELGGTMGGSFDAVLDRVAGSLGEAPGTFRPGSVLPRVGLDVLLAEPAPSRAQPDGPEARPPAPEGGTGAPPGGTGPYPADRHGLHGSAATAPDPDPASARRAAAVLDLLRAAGFPDRLLAGLAGTLSRDLTVEAAFALVPPVPRLPSVPGSLIAVVGDGEEARDAARMLALELGLDPDDVAVAAPWRAARSIQPGMFVQTPEEAAALSPGWRRDRIGLVAVGAPLSAFDHEWTRAILQAMRPSATWGRHLATTKPEDVARWARLIGGLDALLLDHVDRTVTPAAALAAGIPVARLDGVPATPAHWARVTTALVTTGATATPSRTAVTAR